MLNIIYIQEYRILFISSRYHASVGEYLLQSGPLRGTGPGRHLQHHQYTSPHPAFKLQNKQIIEEGGHTKYFFHSFMQVNTLFLGEVLSLPLYWFFKWKNPENYE